jgi:Arylsulfotransferase (ASST)
MRKLAKIPVSTRRFVLASVAVLTAAAGLVAFPTVAQLGLTISKPGVQPGYVIYAAPDGNVYAIDVKGNVAKKWSSPEPGATLGYTRPLENGNLLARMQPVKGAGGDGYAEAAAADSVTEFTQEGKVVWKYAERERSLHHDHERMENGNTLFVCSKDLNRPDISKKLLRDDCLIEVDKAGKVVWQWQTVDHLDELELPKTARDEIMQGYGGERTGPGAPPQTKGFDYLHMNGASPIPASAASTTDSRFREGNIIVSYRYISTLAIIDKTSGKIVWKMTGVSIGQHNPYFIPAPLPGAGHILVFDNGNVDETTNPMHISSRPNSRILEINPSDKKIVWEYTAAKSNRPFWTFFSHYISGAQRQPNGNTLICEGANGRFFEVTPAGEIVWEYVNPVANNSTKTPNYTVFRVAKVPESWLKH